MTDQPKTDRPCDTATPADLASALTMVRALWADGQRRGISAKTLSWALLIEGIDRIVDTHGADETIALLERLGAVLTEENNSPTLQ